MIYRFKQPILLSNGKWLGNRDKKKGPLGGEAFIDRDDPTSEIQRLIKEQCAKESAEPIEEKQTKKRTLKNK